MTETIFLIVNQNGIQGMRKTLPNVHRGEIPVKLTVTVPKEAFNPPVLQQEIVVNDWRLGIDLDDVEFRSNIITAEEAERIRQARIEKMKQILENQGFVVTTPEKDEVAK